jgi:hypothetical protein
MNLVPEMNRTKFVDLKSFYNFYYLHFFCRTRFNDSKPFWKRGPKFPRGPKLEALTGRNVDYFHQRWWIEFCQWRDHDSVLTAEFLVLDDHENCAENFANNCWDFNKEKISVKVPSRLFFWRENSTIYLTSPSWTITLKDHEVNSPSPLSHEYLNSRWIYPYSSMMGRWPFELPFFKYLFSFLFVSIQSMYYPTRSGSPGI